MVETSLKQYVLTASDHLNKATLLTTLLNEVSQHIHKFLEAITQKTKKTLERLDLPNV